MPTPNGMPTPADTGFGYTCHCTHPDTGTDGCWLFRGDDHRKPGMAISPLFNDLLPLWDWMKANGWRSTPGGCWAAERIAP
jgi:hypothetical protein